MLQAPPCRFLRINSGVNPGELRLGHALRCIGHPFQTQIGAVGEDGGEQRAFIFDRLAGTKIGEGMSKAGAAADFVQKLGKGAGTASNRALARFPLPAAPLPRSWLRRVSRSQSHPIRRRGAGQGARLCR